VNTLEDSPKIPIGTKFQALAAMLKKIHFFLGGYAVSTGTYLPTIRARVHASYLVHDSLSTEREVLIGHEVGGI